MKILHVLMTDKFSGAEKVAIDLIKNAKSNEYEFCYFSKKGSIEEILIENSITYELCEKISIKEIKKVIRKYKPDIIHCHDFTATILTCCCGENIPIISHIHQNPTWIQKKGFKSILYKFFQKKIDLVISVSPSFFKEYVYTNYIKQKLVLSNIIDLSNLKYKYNHDSDKCYDLLFLGRLAEVKDPLKCLEIFKRIQKNNPKINLAFVGDGELKQECLNFVRINKLENNVKFFGFCKDISCYLNQSKILINTSKWEGFGLSVVEGMSYGLPVVCNNVGGLINLVDSECGLLCTNDSDFIEEINKLLFDKNYYDKKSKNAYNKSKGFENVKEYTNKVFQIYNILLEEN